jgi:hypothetical protein
MSELSPVDAYLDRAAKRIRITGDAVRTMLQDPAQLDPNILLPAISAGALIERHMHHPARTAALELLENPALAHTLNLVLPTYTLAQQPVFSPTMAHEDKVRTLQTTIELGALWGWTAPPLRDAIEAHIGDQTDAMLVDGNAHIDLHAAVMLLAEVARFDAAEHPLGFFMATAFTSTVGAQDDDDDDGTWMSRAIDHAIGQKSPWERWFDAIEASFARIGKPVTVQRPTRAVAYAAFHDGLELQRFTLRTDASVDEEINIVVDGTSVGIEWQGPQDDPPTGVSVAGARITTPPTSKTTADGFLRYTWSFEGVAPIERIQDIRIDFTSGRTWSP